MFNWLKEMADIDFNTQPVDTEDFLMGFDYVLSPEIQEILAGQNKTSRRIKNTDNEGKLILDEHELALS